MSIASVRFLTILALHPARTGLRSPHQLMMKQTKLASFFGKPAAATNSLQAPSDDGKGKQEGKGSKSGRKTADATEVLKEANFAQKKVFAVLTAAMLSTSAG